MVITGIQSIYCLRTPLTLDVILYYMSEQTKINRSYGFVIEK